MRRSLLSLVAVLLLSVTLGACGGAEKGTPTPETPGAGPAGGTVSIDLWHSESAANVDTLERLISRYNSSQDEVKVQAFFQGTDEELTAKLVTSLGSGKVPAIAVVGEVDTQKMIDSGAMIPVQDFIDREGFDLSDLDEKSVHEYTVQGKLWGMPFGSGVPLLYYNKVTFREVGLDPEKPPRDLEEVRQYSEKLLKRDAAGNVVRSGLAIDNQEWTQRALAGHGDLLVDNNNGRDGRATKVLFDNDTGRWFFQWWHDMVDQGLAFNVGRNLTYADGFLAIVSGRAAMTFSYSNALRSVIDALEKGIPGVEIGVAALPGLPGGMGGAPLLFGRVLWILNLRPEREQEAAWKFIKWLMEPEQQAEWFAGTGYLPISHSAVDLPAAKDVVARYPQFQVPLDLYLNSPTTPAALNALIGPNWQVAETLHQAAEAMLSGAKDPDTALEEAAARANQIIDEYNRRVGGGG
jgi:sn-glycerol 3-phosphate transport system substrate-binding protein